MAFSASGSEDTRTTNECSSHAHIQDVCAEDIVFNCTDLFGWSVNGGSESIASCLRKFSSTNQTKMLIVSPTSAAQNCFTQVEANARVVTSGSRCLLYITKRLP
jgi:hypothetical protein